MTKRKIIEYLESTEKPATLLVGGGSLGAILCRMLEDFGSEVTVIESYHSPLSGAALNRQYDYIFQFADFSQTDNLIENNLRGRGKILLIESAAEKVLPTGYAVRIIRPFEFKDQDETGISRKILKVMFTSAKNAGQEKAHKKATVKIKRNIPVITEPISVKSIPAEVRTEPEVTAEVLKHDSTALLVKKRHLNFGRLIFFTLALFSFLMLISGAGVLYAMGVRQHYLNFKSDLSSANTAAAAADIRSLRQDIGRVQTGYNLLMVPLFFLKDKKPFANIASAISSTDDLLATTEDLSVNTGSILSTNEDFFSGKIHLGKDDVQRLEKELPDLLLKVNKEKKELSGLELPLISFNPIMNRLTQLSEALSSAGSMLPVFDKLFLADGTRTYMILFQNNMELRPTGGFIGSFGLLTIRDGSITDFKIEDVYTADGQLTGHVDPPLPLRKYLSQPNFFLRDSNFDPDFLFSAQRAAWFLEKEQSVHVDGVIGVNLFVIEKILRSIGSVNLSDFNGEEITADNFFLKAQNASETNFFPGSTQKKDFLTAVSRAIIDKVQNNKSEVFLLVIPEIKESLDQKHILLYSGDEQSEKIVEQYGWGGRMVEVACAVNKEGLTDTGCYPDYLAVNEANLGVNKANYFVSKSVTVQKNIGSDGQTATLLTLAYQNQGVSEVYPTATYTDYLRVFVPLGSRLTSATLNGVPLAPSEIDTENYGTDKISFGFLIKIAAGNKGVINIAYLLPRPVNSDTGSYQFLYQKQGGDKNSPLVFSLTHPKEMNLKPLNFQSTSGRTGEIFYTTDTSVDRIFALGLSK